MTEKQRLLNILSRFGDDISVESVIYTFIREADKDFSDLRLNRFIIGLTEILYDKQLDCERVSRVSLERATYLKNYLDGKLYKDEETARKYVDVQKANAQAIIDVCKRAKQKIDEKEAPKSLTDLDMESTVWLIALASLSGIIEEKEKEQENNE